MSEGFPARRIEVEDGSATPHGLAVGFVGACGSIAVAVAIGLQLTGVLPLGYVVSIFQVAVLAAAALFGPWAGLTAALAAFFAYNWFFVEPTFTFDVADPHEVFALGIFLVVAVLTGALAGRLRETADHARRRAETLALLNDFSERVAALSSADEVRSLIVRRVAAAVDGSAILIERRGAATVCECWPETDTPAADERRAAARVLADGEKRADPRFAHVFHPLRTADGIVAVLGVAHGDGSIGRIDEGGLTALMGQAAAALERARLGEARAAAEAETERERLRSALLSSLSHDLRTPLATILGSVTSLRELGDRMEPADRADLLAAIEEETDRLSRFVADLLAMTRLEAGLDARRDFVDLAEPIAAAVAHLHRVHAHHVFDLAVAARDVTVRGDATLIEQVIFNLGDNAAKASPVGTPITLDLARDGDEAVVTVTDRGSGMAGDDVVRLFGPVATRTGEARPETRGGLGLAIARRVVAAMGGVMTAESPSPEGTADRPGTRVVLRLPVEDPSLPPEAKEA